MSGPDEGLGALAPPGPGLRPPGGRDLGERLARLALGAIWTAAHPREPYAERGDLPPPTRHYYRAADGWEAPLWRRPPPPGASGEPVLLAHGLGTGHRGFDFPAGRSLSAALHAAGFDVWMLCHRGDREAVAPPGVRGFDFDDVAAEDVPAALGLVRERTGFERVLWVGHALGGQLLYAHLARGGACEIAAAVSLCAAVRFQAPPSQARLVGLAATLLPPGWELPLRAVQRALSAVADPALWEPLGVDLDGPAARGVLLEASEDVCSGLVRQVARWFATGTLCDRHGRLEIVEALRGLSLPLLAVAAAGDRVCPPAAARPALDALDPALARWLELGPGYGHLDVLYGREAHRVVFPEVVAWLDGWRRRCW